MSKLKFNTAMSMEDYSNAMLERYSKDNQIQRIKSYIKILETNLKGNIAAGKNSLTMGGALGYLDLQGREANLAVNAKHKILAKELGIELKVKTVTHESGRGDIEYTW